MSPQKRNIDLKPLIFGGSHVNSGVVFDSGFSPYPHGSYLALGSCFPKSTPGSRSTECGPRVTAALGRRVRQGAMCWGILLLGSAKKDTRKLLPGTFWALKPQVIFRKFFPLSQAPPQKNITSFTREWPFSTLLFGSN